MPKILEILVTSQIERSFRLGLTRIFGQVEPKFAVQFWQTGLLPYFSSADLTYVENSGKE